MSFASPFLLGFVLLLAPMWYLGRHRRKTLGHSQVGLHRKMSTPFLARVPAAFFVCLWLSLVVAISQPQLNYSIPQTTVLARNLAIIVDVSGSMSSSLTVKDQATYAAVIVDDQGKPVPPTRATAARAGVVSFVQKHSKDRIALMLFNDQVYNVWPLTLDTKVILDKAYLVSQYNAGGTNMGGPDGSSQNIGGIQGALNHLIEMKATGTKIVIIVTDGEDNINEARRNELARQYKEAGVQLYVLGVGESWGSTTKPDLQLLAEQIGGEVIPVGDANAMQAAWDKIDKKLGPTPTIVESLPQHEDIYQYFLYLAGVFAILYLAAIFYVRDES